MKRLLSLLALLTTFAGWAPAQEDQQQDQLEAYFRAARMALRDGPRDRYAVDAASELAGTAPAEILSWVQRETDWVPYEGVLRGASGVLMDRLGNDWDRALLLAALCEHAGITARLATAPWTEAALTGLGDRIDAGTAPLPEPPSDVDLKEFARAARLPQAALEASAESLRWQRQDAHDRANAQVEATTAKLLAVLGHVEPGESAESAPLLPSTGDLHVWVEVLRGEEWVSLDPIDRAAVPGTSCMVAATTVEPSEIDEALYHRLTFRAVAEGWVGTKREEHVLVELSARAAETVGETLEFVMSPLTTQPEMQGAANASDLGDYYKELAAGETQWLATFVFRDEQVFDRGIRCDGSVNESPQMSMTGKAVERAADLIGGLGRAGGGKREALGYTAQWLEIVREGPGLAPSTERRVIFDLVGPLARKAGGERPELLPVDALARNVTLLGASRLLPMACDIPDAYVSRRSLYAIWQQKDFFERVAEEPALPSEELVGLIGELETFDGLLWGMGRARQAWNSRLASFISESQLVIHHERPRIGADGSVLVESGVDVVWNARTHFDPGADGFATGIREGVLDTAAEALLLQAFQPGGARSLSLAAFHGELQVVRDAEALAEAAAAWPADVQLRMARDLASGHVLALPKREVEGLSDWELGYWRVDPTTGACLGMGGQGWGAAVAQEMVENTVMVAFAINTIVIIGQFGQCVAGSTTPAGDAKCVRSLVCSAVLALTGIVVANPIVGAVGGGLCALV